MAKKRYTTEQVIMKLREIEVMTGQGSSVTMACRQAGIGEQTYFRWYQYRGQVNVPKAKPAPFWSRF